MRKFAFEAHLSFHEEVGALNTSKFYVGGEEVCAWNLKFPRWLTLSSRIDVVLGLIRLETSYWLPPASLRKAQHLNSIKIVLCSSKLLQEIMMTSLFFESSRWNLKFSLRIQAVDHGGDSQFMWGIMSSSMLFEVAASLRIHGCCCLKLKFLREFLVVINAAWSELNFLWGRTENLKT
jgi:hypothetical protein